MEYFAEFAKHASNFVSSSSKFQDAKIHEKMPAIIEAVDTLSDSTPIIGHVKGVYHYFTNEKEKAVKSVDEATRTTAVMTGGISGFAVGGVFGAVAGGGLAGASYDYAASEYHGTSVRSKKAFQDAIADPTQEKMFNAYIFPVIDAFTGYIGADIYSSIRKAPAITYGSTRQFIVNETKKHFVGENGEIIKKKILETFILKNPYVQESAINLASQIPKIGAITAIYPYGKQMFDHFKKDS